MKRISVVLAILVAVASWPMLRAQSSDAAEILRLRDQADRASDEAAAASEAARQLQIKLDQQTERIAALESQLDAINRAAEDVLDAKAAAKTAEERAARQKIVDEQWAAAAPERARKAAELQVAVDQWRAAIKRTPSMIIVPNKTTGGASVSIDGKVRQFKSLSEANAFAAEVKQKALATATPTGKSAGKL
ncbi:MAG: hypothetical protein ABI222_18050 [Opitutaceae bacterium]